MQFYLNIVISCSSESESFSNIKLRRNLRISFLKLK